MAELHKGAILPCFVVGESKNWYVLSCEIVRACLIIRALVSEPFCVVSCQLMMGIQGNDVVDEVKECFLKRHVDINGTPWMRCDVDLLKELNRDRAVVKLMRPFW